MARTGTATVFPHTIAMAAFDPELLEQVADAISTEGRAMYNKSLEFGNRDICKNLTYRFPNISIFRDPRWRRGQETYGEGPFLTASPGVSYVKGDSEYLKAAGCAQAFCRPFRPERLRHTFDAKVSEKDLTETNWWAPITA